MLEFLGTYMVLFHWNLLQIKLYRMEFPCWEFHVITYGKIIIFRIFLSLFTFFIDRRDIINLKMKYRIILNGTSQTYYYACVEIIYSVFIEILEWLDHYIYR
jgi:hypothetical protein